MIKITVYLEQEQLEDIFENVEVKFTKKKMKELKDIVNEVEMDVQEQLEERFAEVLEELITDRWEK